MKPRARILVVDDDPAILDLTATVLGAAAYEVGRARSGQDALRAARRERFDLLLLDINMPEMDGWETLRLLKTDEDVRDLPVIMFSVKGEVRDRIHGMQEGAVDYLTKPFEVDDLLLRVQRVLDRQERVATHGAGTGGS